MELNTIAQRMGKRKKLPLKGTRRKMNTRKNTRKTKEDESVSNTVSIFILAGYSIVFAGYQQEKSHN